MEFHDLEDKLSDDLSKHPEGCTCGKCGHDHSHEGKHVPKHTHGKGAYKDLDKKLDQAEVCGCTVEDHGHAHEHEHAHEHNHEHEHEHKH